MTHVRLIVAELDLPAGELGAVLDRFLTTVNGHRPAAIAAPAAVIEFPPAADDPVENEPVRRRKIRGGGGRGSRRPKSRAAGLRRSTAGRPRFGLTEAQVAEAKRRWDAGDGPTAIGKSVGKGPTWAYNACKQYGWGPRGGGSAPKPAKAARGKLSGPAMKTERRCANCGQRTSADPCSHCFEAAD